MKALFLRWVHDRRGAMIDDTGPFVVTTIFLLLVILLSVVMRYGPPLISEVLRWLRHVFESLM